MSFTDFNDVEPGTNPDGTERRGHGESKKNQSPPVSAIEMQPIVRLAPTEEPEEQTVPEVDVTPYIASEDELAKQQKLNEFCEGFGHTFTTTRLHQQYFEIFRQGLFYQPLVAGDKDYEFSYTRILAKSPKVLEPDYTEHFYKYLSSLGSREAVKPYKCVLKLSANREGEVLAHVFDVDWMVQQMNALATHVDAEGYFPFEGVVIDWYSLDFELNDTQHAQLKEALDGLIKAFDGSAFFIEVKSNEARAPIYRQSIDFLYDVATNKPTTDVCLNLVQVDGSDNYLGDDRVAERKRKKPLMHVRPTRKKKKDPLYRPIEEKLNESGMRASKSALLRFLRKNERQDLVIEYADAHEVEAQVVQEVSVQIEIQDTQRNPSLEGERLRSFEQIRAWSESHPDEYAKYNENAIYTEMSKDWVRPETIEGPAMNYLYQSLILNFKSYGVGKRVTHITEAALKFYAGPGRAHFLSGCSLEHLPVGFYIKPLEGAEDQYSLHYDPLDKSVDSATPLSVQPRSPNYEEQQQKRSRIFIMPDREFLKTLVKQFPVLNENLIDLKLDSAWLNLGHALNEKGPENLKEILRQLELTLSKVSNTSWYSFKRAGTENEHKHNADAGKRTGSFSSPRVSFIKFFLANKNADIVRNFMSIEGVAALQFLKNTCTDDQKDTFIQILTSVHLRLYPNDSFVDMMKAYEFFIKEGKDFANLKIEGGAYSGIYGQLSKHYALWLASNFSATLLATLKNFQDRKAEASRRNTVVPFSHFPTGYSYIPLSEKYTHIDPLQELDISELKRNQVLYNEIFGLDSLGFEVNFDQLVRICQFDSSRLIGVESFSIDGYHSFCLTSLYRYLGQQISMDFTFENFEKLTQGIIEKSSSFEDVVQFFPLLALLYSGKEKSEESPQQDASAIDEAIFSFNKLIGLYPREMLDKVYYWLLKTPGKEITADSVNGMLKVISLFPEGDVPVWEPLFEGEKLSDISLSAFKKIADNATIDNSSSFAAVLGDLELRQYDILLFKHSESLLNAISVLDYTRTHEGLPDGLNEFYDELMSIEDEAILVAILEGISFLIAGPRGQRLTFGQAVPLIQKAKSEETPFNAKKTLINGRPVGVHFDANIDGQAKLKWFHDVKYANAKLKEYYYFDYAVVMALSLNDSIERVLPKMKAWDRAGSFYKGNVNIQRLVKTVALYPFALLQDKYHRLGWSAAKEKFLVENLRSIPLAFGLEENEMLESAFTRSDYQSKNVLNVLNWIKSSAENNTTLGYLICVSGGIKTLANKQKLQNIMKGWGVFWLSEKFKQKVGIGFSQLIKADGILEFIKVIKPHLSSRSYYKAITEPVLRANIQSPDYYLGITDVLNCKNLTQEQRLQFMKFMIDNQSEMSVLRQLVSAINRHPLLPMGQFFQLLSPGNVGLFKTIFCDPALHPLLSCMASLEDTTSLEVLVGHYKDITVSDKETYVEVLKHYLEDDQVVSELSINIDAIKQINSEARFDGGLPSYSWVSNWLSSDDIMKRNLIDNIEKQPFGKRDYETQFKNDLELKSRIEQMYSNPIFQAKLYDAVGYVNSVGQDYALHYAANLDARFAKPVCEFTNEELKEASLRIRQELDENKADYNEDSLLSIQLEFLAITREAFYRGDNPKHGGEARLAYQTQLLSVINNLLFDNNMNYGINTGEGKSVTTALMAACEWVNGKTVDLTTSSLSLAERDFRNTKAFYNRLGIPVGLVYKNSAMDVYQDKGVNIACAPQLAIWQIRAGLEGRELPENRTLISDEFDELALDSNSSFNFSRPNVNPNRPKENPFAWVYKHVVDYVEKVCERPSAYERYRIGQDVDNLKDYLLGISDLNAEKKDAITDGSITRSMLSEWLDAGFKAATLTKNDHYVVRNEKGKNHVYLFKNEIDREGRYSYGIHQMLQAKHNVDITPESLNIGSMSPQAFLKQYSVGENRLIGLTGTPGNDSEKTELHQDYGLHTFNVPYHKPHQGSRMVPEVVDSSKYADGAHVQKIRDFICNQLKTEGDQAIVIFMDNSAAVEKLYKKLRKDGYFKTRCQKYTGSEPDVKVPDVLAQAAKKGMITITTDVLGRGADFTVNLDEGLLVVQTSIEDSVRKMRQRIGRQARNGKKGRYKEIYSAASLGIMPGSSMEDIDARVKQVHDGNDHKRSLMRYESKLTGFYKEQCMDKFLEIFHAKIRASQAGSNAAGTDIIRKELYKKCSIFLRNFTEYWNQCSSSYKYALSNGDHVMKDLVKHSVYSFARQMPRLFQSAFGEPITLVSMRDASEEVLLKPKSWKDPKVKMKYSSNLSALGRSRLLANSNIESDLTGLFPMAMKDLGVGLVGEGDDISLNAAELEGKYGDKATLMIMTHLLCDCANKYPRALHEFSEKLKRDVLIRVDSSERNNIIKCLAALRKFGFVSMGSFLEAETRHISECTEASISEYAPGWFAAKNRKVLLKELKNHFAPDKDSLDLKTPEELLTKLDEELLKLMQEDLAHNQKVDKSKMRPKSSKRNIDGSTFLTLSLRARHKLILNLIAKCKTLGKYKRSKLIGWRDCFAGYMALEAKGNEDLKSKLVELLNNLNRRSTVRKNRDHTKVLIKWMIGNKANVTESFPRLATMFDLMLTVFVQEEMKMKWSTQMREKDAKFVGVMKESRKPPAGGAGAGASASATP